jgi:uncharacterized protein
VALRIGIISDTHGLLRPEAVRQLSRVDHILHAGDIGRPDIIWELRSIAPVTAIRGNVDGGDWARAYPETERVLLAEQTFYMLHDLKTLDVDPAAAGIHVIVSGHSHAARLDAIGGVLFVNPGSSGPRRFKLPVTIAIIEVASDGLHPTIHELF